MHGVLTHTHTQYTIPKMYIVHWHTSRLQIYKVRCIISTILMYMPRACEWWMDVDQPAQLIHLCMLQPFACFSTGMARNGKCIWQLWPVNVSCGFIAYLSPMMPTLLQPVKSIVLADVGSSDSTCSRNGVSTLPKRNRGRYGTRTRWAPCGATYANMIRECSFSSWDIRKCLLTTWGFLMMRDLWLVSSGLSMDSNVQASLLERGCFHKLCRSRPGR